MNVESVIDKMEEEIGQLVIDMSYVNNEISVDALKTAVSNKEDRIVELKVKYNIK